MNINPLSAHFPFPFRYEMYTTSTEECEKVYSGLKPFWIERCTKLAGGGGGEDEKRIADSSRAELIKKITDQYREEVTDKNRVLPASKAAERAHALTGGDRVCRVLEVGGANGTLVHTLKKMGRDSGIHLTNFEPWGPYVDDFKAHLPEHQVIHADVEQFLDITGKAPFAEEQFDIFYESVALCMMPPRLVRAVLAKAAELCREIVMYDYVLNGMSDVNTEQNLVFEFSANTGQVYFAHNYPRYFGEIGFKVESMTPLLSHMDKPVEGYGVLHAVPADA
ncbi:MAG: class I SAM-dependent methyltransferase [Rhodospirillales bacterium]